MLYTNVLNQYLELSTKITELENQLPEKKKTFEKEFSCKYATLKKNLHIYIDKIKPTVTAICNLYSNKVSLSGEICFSNGSGKFENPNVLSYNPFNAYDVSQKAADDSITYLRDLLLRKDIDSNLNKFAIRYNTVMRVYLGIDTLCSEAVSISMCDCNKEINKLKAKRDSLFKNANEFNSMLMKLQADGEKMRQKLMIDDHMKFETNFVTEITLPMAYEECDEKSLTNNNNQKRIILSLLEWKLHEDGIMIIKSNKSDIDSTDLTDCTINTIIKFLFSYPAKSKRILLCDSASSNAITTFAGILKNEDLELFFDNANGSFVKNSEDDIRTSISNLNKTINQRIMTLGQSRHSNVLEYNNKNPDNPMPLILVFLNAFPFRYEGATDDLVSAFKNGKAAGVYFIITEDICGDEDSKYYRKAVPKLEEITKNIAEYSIADGKGYLGKNSKIYVANTRGEKYNIHSVLSAFKKSVKNESNTVYLDNVVGKEDFHNNERRQKYSKVLSIPIGKQGSNPISIDLNADGTGAHLAVIGTTGSGKTAFMNSFILSASNLYSPDELELHLIVMVKEDFKVFEEERLPHLKTVVTGDNIFSANDVLDFIDDEMKRRGNLIGSYGNIYAYNTNAKNDHKKPLPRCVIIIDEFYQLVQGNDEAIDRINRIAQVGRAYGISLVISSIRFPMEVNSIIPLFGNRIEFKSDENAGQLIPQAANRQSELIGFKGSCFFERGGDIKHVRVAFSEEGEKLKNHIKNVRNKYSDFEMNLQSEIKAVNVRNEQDAPFSTKKAKINYTEEGIIRARLGTTYLSNRALEYPFTSKNNLLFLLGDYIATKTMEASLIKDTLLLSENVDSPTVYYLDYNKNASLRRAKYMVKDLMLKWAQAEKMIYSSSDEFCDTLNEIKKLIQTRQDDYDSDLSPVLVVIAKADEIFSDDNENIRDDLLSIIDNGKENNVYFAIQCSEPISFFGCDKYLKDAIIFPDRYGDSADYASTELCAALEAMPAGSTEQGKKLIRNASQTAMDPHLHILCDNNRISVFIPYEYDEKYLSGILD